MKSICMEFKNTLRHRNDDEFYYVNIWGRDADDKVYRCDGYECCLLIVDDSMLTRT